MNRIIYKGFAAAFIALTLTACAGRKAYERPNVIDEKLFRADQVPADSLSSANVSWRNIFTDATLQGHINKALSNNLDVRVAMQNVASAQVYLKQSKAAFIPTLSVGANYTRSTNSINAMGGVGERTYGNLWDLTGAASWEADIWGKLSAQRRASYASYLATVEAQKAVQSEVVATLATAYYQLLMLDEQKKVLEQTIDFRQKSLETTKSLKEAGSTTEVATKQIEALVYNAQAQLVTIGNNIWALENTICVLLGEEPHTIERTTLAQQQFPTEFKQGYAAKLLQNRPDVARAELSLRNAFEMTNVARAAFYPTLTLSARGGISSTELDTWISAKSIFANFVAGLAQPILNRRQIRTQYEVQQIAQETALLNFKKAVLSAGKEVSDAMQNFSTQTEFIELKTKEMKAYQEATDYSKQLFDSGMVNYLEVITAEVNRLNAELSVANAQFTRMQYGITLYKALGGGWR
ncbi:efflux transporter, outer membrane factor (OMF) lipoprotein, NodT family [Capnocytophaga granulosa]|uniref:Efflux transporter, outer membrane factor (OMF) lipoprotein, NodT family n=1 Tax=Capnocytophaga granulosa TaxID=45242 RepID=A0A1H2VIL6_9FLAO|nr:efflux transporter outer membrane subunit [Capnocytophaga granulosa]EPD28420.1 NodT family efflux transporter, outer membrane factor (OMF) lipoprotein [Capnocytophaga granulosa ATCC 51502]SDW68162.1 efflux transporter, outer membrane factor (OMF) lipoprotein, NodT family [Capnocytophaga granulosa]SUX17497.1 Outer membrane protein oprM precursor [Capnocytophaga granulosa]